MNKIFIIHQIFVFALLVAIAGCSDSGGVRSIHQSSVMVSTNLPVSLRNAVLHISIREPIGSSATNYLSWGGSISLNHPSGNLSGGGVSTYVSYKEDRLIAIVPEGFKLLFTRRDNGILQTNLVLFRYAEVTQTNTLGWNIVGKF